MEINELLRELYGRIGEHIDEALDGVEVDLLAEPPAPGANTIGWLVWHLTRVQDHHISELLDEPQLWVTDGWAAKFGLEADPDNTGYGHTATEVESIRPESVELLQDYYGAVWGRTAAFLTHTSAADLDRVVDTCWDPPVTLAVRLISVADDDIMHAGQATYARGILERRAG